MRGKYTRTWVGRKGCFCIWIHFTFRAIIHILSYKPKNQFLYLTLNYQDLLPSLKSIINKLTLDKMPLPTTAFLRSDLSRQVYSSYRDIVDI